MLFGQVQPDSGTVAVRKRARVGYVTQISEFAPGDSVRSVMEGALEQGSVPHAERMSRIAETLGRAGFTDFDASTSSLSGGWRKRLAISAGLAQKPDVLLLDEPTNHLDLAGIEWLETVLQNAPFACVVVSHDRYFLETFATAILEVNPLYRRAFCGWEENYSTFPGRPKKGIPACHGTEAGVAREPRPHRDRVAAPGAESARDQGEGTHRSKPRR